jgi:hypothetical protein
MSTERRPAGSNFFAEVILCSFNHNYHHQSVTKDRLCGLVVRVPGYRSGGLWFDSRAMQKERKKKVVGLERGHSAS